MTGADLLVIASGLVRVAAELIDAAKAGKSYTVAQVDGMLAKYTEGRVMNNAQAQAVIDAATKAPVHATAMTATLMPPPTYHFRTSPDAGGVSVEHTLQPAPDDDTEPTE